jgi:glycosyltransferase involved in cell wall biosynthesis
MVKKKDRVLLYNFMPEYLPALLLLRLKGNPAILDVEDAPRLDLFSGHHFLGWITYKAVRFLCQRRYLTVSLQVANAFGLQPACVVYGATPALAYSEARPWLDQTAFRILYGGSLCEETGLSLFCDTVKQLQQSLSIHADRKTLVFVVTGFGGEAQLESLHTQCDHQFIIIEKKTNLTMTQYQNELLSCHAALCLKMPESEMGATTFPSKVVEITSAGLLLISTKASDIPQLFNDQNALLLNEATPEQLCSAILWAMDHPDECQDRARRGHAQAMELFAEASVGQRIRDFMFR